MIIPYINFELGLDLPIKEIIIGPTPNINAAADSITTLMLSNNLKHTKIIHSKVPYRTW